MQAGGPVDLVEVGPHLRLVHRHAAAMFVLFLGDRRVFVSGLAEDEVVGIAIEDLATQVKVAEVGETALGKSFILGMNVAARAHAVHETDARPEHRGAAQKITVRPHCLAHGLHPQPEALDTSDRRIVGLETRDMLVPGLDVVFQAVAHEVHLEIGNAPIFLHVPDALGDVRSRPGMGVIKIGILHDPVRHFLHVYDHFAILIVQEVFGVGLANFGGGIAPEPIEVETGSLSFGFDPGDDRLDAAGQVRAHRLVISTLDPPSSVDLDHVRLRSELVQRIHVFVDILVGENPPVVIPRCPAFVVGGLKFRDSVLRRDGRTELIEQREPVVGALEDDLLVLNGLAGLELFALAMGPDLEGPVFERKIRQENAPRERTGEQILAVAQAQHLIHVAGTFLGLGADIFPQQRRAPHAAAPIDHLQVIG